MTGQLSPGRFYQRDPLLRTVRDHLHARAFWIVLPALFVYCAVFLLAPYLLLVSQSRFAGLLGNYVLQCLLHPLGIAIYLRLPDELAHLFNSLEQNRVFDHVDDSAISSYQEQLSDRVDRFRWPLGALLVVALFWTYRIGSGIEWRGLDFVRSEWRAPLIALRAAVYAPAEYGLILSAIRFIVSLGFAGQMFRSTRIRLNPLHPDGCGGAGAIGRLLTISVLVAVMIAMGAVGMALVAAANGIPVFGRPETWLLGIGYLVAVPALFICCLMEPHRAMKAARDVALGPLSEQFARVMAESVSSSDGQAIEAHTDHLTELARQYSFLKATIPIFPVRTGALKGLLVTSLAPITAFILSFLQVVFGFMSINR